MRRVGGLLTRSGPAPLLVVAFWALVLPVLLADGGDATAGSRDEHNFHLPTIRQLADELPSPDIVHVHTATAPGFHLVLGVFGRLVTDDREALELVAALFSLALVLAAYRVIAARARDRWMAFALTLPLLCSHYVVQSAAWLNTDNAALLFVVLTLGVALEPPVSAAAAARGGLYVFFAVWARQLTLWGAGPFLFAAGLAGRFRDRRPVLLAGLALVPAVASVGVLALVWGGPTPPRFAAQSGTSPAAFPFTLALAGLFGWFFAACATRRDDLLRGRAPLLAAGGGALLALLAPTSEDPELQRRTGGGLWEVAGAAPQLADRSLAILVLAAAGGVVLVGLWRAAVRAATANQPLVVLVAMACLAFAQAATVRTFQRYFEPAVLVMLALLTAFARPPRSRVFAAMAVLVAVQLVGVFWAVYEPTF